MRGDVWERVVTGLARLRGTGANVLERRGDRRETTGDLLIEPHDSARAPPNFSCGDADLDGFLRDDAARLQEQAIVSVYLATYEGVCVGYVAILADAVKLKSPEKKRLRLQRQDHPNIPAIKIARLAVSAEFRNATAARVQLSSATPSTSLTWRQRPSAAGC